VPTYEWLERSAFSGAMMRAFFVLSVNLLSNGYMPGPPANARWHRQALAKSKHSSRYVWDDKASEWHLKPKPSGTKNQNFSKTERR
jgi:hypothetical protein